MAKPRWRSPVLALAVALWLVQPEVVEASLGLIFVPPAALPGATVTAHTGGQGAFTVVRTGAALSVFLAPAALTDQITNKSDPRLLAIGNLKIDDHANGSMSFVVPDVTYGDYQSFIYCEPCAQHSGGRTLIPTGPFHIGTLSETSPSQQASSQSSGGLIGAAAMTVGLIAVVLAALLLYRRGSRTS